MAASGVERRTNAAAQFALELAPDADGMTRVVGRHVRYPYTFLKPFWFGDAPHGLATIYQQSASGGVYGGERLAQRLRLAAGAAAQVTNQAATIVHAARAHGPARQSVDIALAAHAFMEFLPEPLLLYPESAFEQTVSVELDPSAQIVLVDGMVSHDPNAGQKPFAHYASTIQIRATDGTLLCRDRIAIDGRDFARALVTPQGDWAASGLVLCVAPSVQARHAEIAAALEVALTTLAPESVVYASAALLPNACGVGMRIAARDGASLRAALEASWRCLRMSLTGSAAPRRRK